MKIIIIFFLICACLSSQVYAYAKDKEIYFGNPLFEELKNGYKLGSIRIEATKIKTMKFNTFELTDDFRLSVNIKIDSPKAESILNKSEILFQQNHLLGTETERFSVKMEVHYSF